MESKAIKEFTVREGSVGTYYKIEVLFRGKVVDTFFKPTMKEAQSAFENAGYIAVVSK